MKNLKQIGSRYRIAIEGIICFIFAGIENSTELYENKQLTENELGRELWQQTAVLFCIFKECPELWEDLIDEKKEIYYESLKIADKFFEHENKDIEISEKTE